MAVIRSLGKETLGYTDPPPMNLNKVRESITDYQTAILIAVIDNVVAQLTWWWAWSKGQQHSWWGEKPCCCDGMGWCLMVWYTALVNQDWFGLWCPGLGLSCMWQLCRVGLQFVRLQPFQVGLLLLTWPSPFGGTRDMNGVSTSLISDPSFSFKRNLGFRREIEWMHLFLSEKQ